MTTIVCPCCQGRGTIVEHCPVALTPLQFAIYDVVRRAPRGIGGRELCSRIYARRPDGGPLNAMTSMYLTIRKVNAKLATARLRVISDRGGPHALYRLAQLPDVP